jgi:hypothetical protein
MKKNSNDDGNMRVDVGSRVYKKSCNSKINFNVEASFNGMERCFIGSLFFWSYFEHHNHNMMEVNIIFALYLAQ